MVKTGKIVFSAGSYGFYNLYLIDLTKMTLNQLTVDEFWNDNPRLSPDMSKVAFTSSRDGGMFIYFYHLADGSIERMPCDFNNASQPAWSPDGRFLAFVSNDQGSDDIYIIDLETQNVKILVQTPGVDAYPDWSPCGKYIAYSSEREGNLDIYTCDVLNGAEKRISTHSSLDFAPAWSPDGENIAFVSSRPDSERKRSILSSLWDMYYGDDDLDIWIINLDSGMRYQCTDNRGVDRNVRWSADGTKLIFTTSVHGDPSNRLSVYDVKNNKAISLEKVFPSLRELLDNYRKNAGWQGVFVPTNPAFERKAPHKIIENIARLGAFAERKKYFCTERYIDWRG